MSSTTIAFPEDTIQCSKGNYILRSTEDGRWQAFQVEDVVLLRRLVPLQLNSSMVLIEEEHLRDSEPVEGMGEIHLLVTSYPEEFDSTRTAMDTIETHKLVQGTQGVCMNIKHFPKANSLTYQLLKDGSRKGE